MRIPSRPRTRGWAGGWRRSRWSSLGGTGWTPTSEEGSIVSVSTVQGTRGSCSYSPHSSLESSTLVGHGSPLKWTQSDSGCPLTPPPNSKRSSSIPLSDHSTAPNRSSSPLPPNPPSSRTPASDTYLGCKTTSPRSAPRPTGTRCTTCASNPLDRGGHV